MRTLRRPLAADADASSKAFAARWGRPRASNLMTSAWGSSHCAVRWDEQSPTLHSSSSSVGAARHQRPRRSDAQPDADDAAVVQPPSRCRARSARAVRASQTHRSQCGGIRPSADTTRIHTVQARQRGRAEAEAGDAAAPISFRRLGSVARLRVLVPSRLRSARFLRVGGAGGGMTVSSHRPVRPFSQARLQS